MVTLFDIMRNAQSGRGLDNLSHQFGLSPADTQRAVEALLPAFTLGFQRSMHNPNAFGEFVDLLSSGQYAPFFDAPKPPKAAAWASGNEALTKILGSKEVTRQIAEQAASTTGIGAQVLQQMLPMLAATIVGGVFRYASLQGMGDLFAQWSEAFHRAHDAQERKKRADARRAEPRPQPAWMNPFEAWAAMMGSMFGADNTRAQPARTSRTASPPEPASRPATNPVEAWSNLIETMLGKPMEVAPSAPASKPPAPPPPAENPLQTLAQMFETGREVQAQHLATLQAILDGFWGSGRTR
jgi:hypothetical protein